MARESVSAPPPEPCTGGIGIWTTDQDISAMHDVFHISSPSHAESQIQKTRNTPLYCKRPPNTIIYIYVKHTRPNDRLISHPDFIFRNVKIMMRATEAATRRKKAQFKRYSESFFNMWHPSISCHYPFLLITTHPFLFPTDIKRRKLPRTFSRILRNSLAK